MIDISGLDKAAVLASLYNNSRPQGRGLLNPGGWVGMSVEQAQEVLAAAPSLDFTYLNGRVLKTDLSGDEFDEWLYDRDNGDGAACRAVEALRTSGSVERI